MALSYVYEVRHGGQLVATGRLTQAEPIEVGDRLTIGQHTGLVRSMQPQFGEQEPRVVIELLPA